MWDNEEQICGVNGKHHGVNTGELLTAENCRASSVFGSACPAAGNVTVSHDAKPNAAKARVWKICENMWLMLNTQSPNSPVTTTVCITLTTEDRLLGLGRRPMMIEVMHLSVSHDTESLYDRQTERIRS